jgi:hypothetical protein
MSASNFDLELQELHQKSVHRLIAAEIFDVEAFNQLKLYLCDKSNSIKQEHVISKQVVSVILDAAGIIESRSEYMPSVREHLPLANDFHMLLGLIAIGEAWGDRVPGVPRVQ